MNFFHPDLFVDGVTELTPERLDKLGLRSLLLDVDCTLKHYRSQELPPDISRWIDTMKALKIGLCLVSNGRGPRIQRFAETVQLPYVAPAMKPLPFALRRAVRDMNFDKNATAMVGDQVFADLLAGKLAGLFTVLVTPLSPDEEPWFARMKRPFEKLVLPPSGAVRQSVDSPRPSSVDGEFSNP